MSWKNKIEHDISRTCYVCDSQPGNYGLHSTCPCAPFDHSKRLMLQLCNLPIQTHVHTPVAVTTHAGGKTPAYKKKVGNIHAFRLRCADRSGGINPTTFWSTEFRPTTWRKAVVSSLAKKKNNYSKHFKHFKHIKRRPNSSRCQTFAAWNEQSAQKHLS